MSDWRDTLKASEDALSMSAVEAARIRAAVVSAARLVPVRSPWPARLSFACAALVLLAAGAGDDGRAPRVAPDVAAVPADGPAERRQVQFMAPGGTRIIWELNPQFTLTETIP